MNHASPPPSRSIVAWVVSGLVRAGLLSLGWGVLSGADTDYLAYGVVSVLLATALSLVLLPPEGPLRWRVWPRRVWFTLVLTAWFLMQSARGGIDVARRALVRPVDIAPAVVLAPIVVPLGHARELSLLLMNLMPGSMVQQVVIESDKVQLHTLSLQLDPAEQWARLQGRVHAAFGHFELPENTGSARLDG